MDAHPARTRTAIAKAPVHTSPGRGCLDSAFTTSDTRSLPTFLSLVRRSPTSPPSSGTPSRRRPLPTMRTGYRGAIRAGSTAWRRLGKVGARRRPPVLGMTLHETNAPTWASGKGSGSFSVAFRGQTAATVSQVRYNTRHSPVAQLVERLTVKRLIILACGVLVVPK